MPRLFLSALLSLVLCPFAVGQSSDWRELAKAISDASDGYEVADESEEFAKVRDPRAMAERVEIFDDKLAIRGGVNLRDWLVTGMMRAESLEEATVLLECASDKKASSLLRLACLRSLRRAECPAPAELLLDRAFGRLDGELQRAWQNTTGKLLAEGRVEFGKKRNNETELRKALFESGAPYLGFRWVTPSDAELAVMRGEWPKLKAPGDRAQLLYVLAAQAGSSEAALALYLDLARKACISSEHAVRVAVWSSALSERVFETAPVLIHGLEFTEAEEPSRHQQDYASALRSLTSQQFGSDAKTWKNWWQRDGEDWLVTARNSKEDSLQAAKRLDEDETVSTYLGIPIDSTRVGFVLDGSGSMNDRLEDGRKIAEAAADEFASFLDRYPQDAIFHLRMIVRASESPFKTAVKANKKNREKAVSYVRRFDFGPASAMYDVLLEAQAEAQLDTLVFISDGGGSWGSFAYPGHMLDGLRLAYERSGVRIHTICVGKSRNKARFMQELAEITSGRMERFGD